MSLLDKFRSLEASFWAKIDSINYKESKGKWLLYMQDRIVGLFDSKEKVFLFLKQLKKESRGIIPEVALCVELGLVPRFHRIVLDALNQASSRRQTMK